MKLLPILLLLAATATTALAGDLPFYMRLLRPLEDKRDTLIIDRLTERSVTALLNGDRATGQIRGPITSAPSTSAFTCTIRLRIPGQGTLIGRFTRTITQQPSTDPIIPDSALIHDQFQGRAIRPSLLRSHRRPFTFTGQQTIYADLR